MKWVKVGYWLVIIGLLSVVMHFALKQPQLVKDLQQIKIYQLETEGCQRVGATRYVEGLDYMGQRDYIAANVWECEPGVYHVFLDRSE